MITKAALAFTAAAALLGPCDPSSPVRPPKGVIGLWGGENAALIADDTSAHVHIGCTYGNIHQLLVPDAEGRFVVPGEHNITAHPVDRGVFHPAQFSGRVVGSARPVSRMDFAHDTLRFSIPSQWESGPNDLQLEAALAGDALYGAVIMPDGTRLPLTGMRARALHGTRVVQWARPVRLLKGVDLAGWHPLPGGESAWQMVAGVLTNAKAGANLATDASYGDFKLHVEFRYPAGGNSGIYLRGRYEVQIEDPGLGVVATEGLGAIYGFIAPSESAGKNAGEWQTYDITLVGRLLTVVLNGREVICRQNIPGITGGAVDSDDGKPGPIFLRGDDRPDADGNI